MTKINLSAEIIKPYELLLITPHELVTKYLDSFFLKFYFSTTFHPDNKIEICYFCDEHQKDSATDILLKLRKLLFTSPEISNVFGLFHNYQCKEYLIIPQSKLHNLFLEESK